jgi:hypothetical protein
MPAITTTSDIELTPERVEYISADKVRVTMTTTAGETVSYTMKSASLVAHVNQSVALINSFSGQILRDMGVL